LGVVRHGPDDDANTVVLHPTEFSMSSGTQDNGMTMHQNDTDVDAQSLLRLTQKFPPRYEHVLPLDFTITIRQAGRERLVLTTKDPAVLMGRLTSFPPKNDMYQLQNPVELVSPHDRSTTVATITQFPLKVGAL
jgi:hypothetical protein